MKSVLQAAWLLTVSFGNLIVVIIAEAEFFERQVSQMYLLDFKIKFYKFNFFALTNFNHSFQSMEFFLFAVLMFVDMVAFAALAVRYKYVDQIEAEKIAYEASEKKGHTNEAFSKEDTKF